MMDLEYLLPACAMAVLARVLVTAEHVLTRVSEAELFPLLILETREPGIPDELEVRGSRFDDAPCGGKSFSTSSMRETGAARMFSTEGASPPLFLL